MNTGIRKYMPSDEKGQTLVEFAIILLLILAVLFGITEFGRAWYYTNALSNGVRTGVRYATTLDNTTSFESKVVSVTMSNITSSIPNNNLTVDVYMAGNPANKAFTNLSSGVLITVDASVDFDVLTGGIVPHFSGTKRLSRQASMRYE